MKTEKTSMPPEGFEPTISAGERPQTYALDRAATGTGPMQLFDLAFRLFLCGIFVGCHNCCALPNDMFIIVLALTVFVLLRFKFFDDCAWRFVMYVS